MSEEQKKPDQSADLARVWGLIAEYGEAEAALALNVEHDARFAQQYKAVDDTEAALRAAITALVRPVESEAISAEARRYRRLRDMASEKLVDPRNSHADLIDTRTEWRLPTLICSGPVGGFHTFDQAVDIATGDSNG